MKHYNIPVFVPHQGCPFDCVFCNQKHITGNLLPVTAESIQKTVDEYLQTLPSDGEVEIAFFGGSFTGIPHAEQRLFLGTAYQYVKAGKVHGIRLSTRPDYIDEKICDQLAEFGVTTVEMGVQSMDEDVLLASQRGHTPADVERAVGVLRKYSFQVGLQMMTGLPQDTPQKAKETAKKIIALRPDFVRIYPTLVVRDTKLEEMYRNGTYTPQTLWDAVSLCKDLLVMFGDADIPVIRVALQTTEEIAPGGAVVAGPFHSAFRELCEGEIYFEKMQVLLEKEKGDTLLVHPRELSKAIGNQKRNLQRLQAQFGEKIKIIGSDHVPEGTVYLHRKEG